MTEFSRGIFKVIASTSAGRALVYTIGHVYIESINISIEPYGNISITAKFDNCSDLKNFETKSKSIFSDVQGSFHLVQK